MRDDRSNAESCVFRARNRAASPLRIATRALLISSRSIEAIRRPNRPWDGANPMEAVLDIVVPFPECSAAPHQHLETIYVYQIPATMHLFA